MMKTNSAGKQAPSYNEQRHSGKRADNKNNLDHREGEEQEIKKGDITHNKKEEHSKKKATEIVFSMSFKKLTSLYTIIVCIFLLGAGGWGLISPVVFGVLSISIYKSVAFIILAVAGLVAGIRADVRSFNICAGIILCFTGMCWFIDKAEVFVRVFHMNAVIAYLDITLGIIFFISGILLPGRPGKDENLVILF